VCYRGDDKGDGDDKAVQAVEQKVHGLDCSSLTPDDSTKVVVTLKVIVTLHFAHLQRDTWM
jgi:hypothetical protein